MLLWAMIATLLLFISILMAITLSRVKVHILVLRDGQDDRMEVKVEGLKGLLKFNRTLPFLQVDPNLTGIQFEADTFNTSGESHHFEEEDNWNGIKHRTLTWIRRIYQCRHLSKHVKMMICSIQITRWVWKSEISAQEAERAAIYYGGIWAIKSQIVALLQHWLTLKHRPELNVTISYHKEWRSRFEMNFNIRMSRIIKVMLLSGRIILQDREIRSVVSELWEIRKLRKRHDTKGKTLNNYNIE